MIENNLEAAAEKVKAVMEHQGYTVNSLAYAANVRHGDVSSWITGHRLPSLKTFFAVCNVLGIININALVDRKKAPTCGNK